MRIDQLPRSENVEDRRGSGGFRVPGGRGGDILTGGRQQQQPQEAPGKTEASVPDEIKDRVSAILGSTEKVWSDIFQKSGRRYEPPTLVMFDGVTRSGCGVAQSAMGPFYCPLDQKVYLDTSFFRDLERRFGACDAGSKACQFSQAYVITHEVGHHVQNL